MIVLEEVRQIHPSPLRNVKRLNIFPTPGCLSAAVTDAIDGALWISLHAKTVLIGPEFHLHENFFFKVLHVFHFKVLNTCFIFMRCSLMLAQEFHSLLHFLFITMLTSNNTSTNYLQITWGKSTEGYYDKWLFIMINVYDQLF